MMAESINKEEGERLMAEYNAATDKYAYVRHLIRDNKMIDNDRTEEVAYLVRTVPSLTSLRDEYNRPLLFLAAYYNRLELVKVMITHGGDAHAQDDDGLTALYWAVWNDSLDVVRHLSHNYPELLEVREMHGRTPYSYAQEYNTACITSLTFFTELASNMGVDPNVEWRKDEDRRYKRPDMPK